MFKKLMSMANPFNAVKTSMTMMQNAKSKGSIGERMNALQDTFKEENQISDGTDIDFTKVEHDFRESTDKVAQHVKSGINNTKEKLDTGVQKMKDGVSGQWQHMKDAGNKFSHASGEAAKTFKEEMNEGPPKNIPVKSETGVYVNSNGTGLAMLEDTQFSLPAPEISGNNPVALQEDTGFQKGTIYAGRNNGALALIEEPRVKELPAPVALKETAEETPPVKSDPLSAELSGYIKDIGQNYDMMPGQNLSPVTKQYFPPATLSAQEKGQVKEMSGKDFQGETRAFSDSMGSQLIVDSQEGNENLHPLASLFDGKEHNLLSIDRDPSQSYVAVAVPDNNDPGTIYLKGQGMKGNSWTGELKKINQFGGEMYMMNVYPEDKAAYMSIVSNIQGNAEQVQVSVGELRPKGGETPQA